MTGANVGDFVMAPCGCSGTVIRVYDSVSISTPAMAVTVNRIQYQFCDRHRDECVFDEFEFLCRRLDFQTAMLRIEE